MKHQRPQLDAFPRRSVFRRRRIDKGRVRDKAGAAVGRRVVAFQEQRFVCHHLRKVKPAVVRIEFHRIGLAIAVRVDEVRGDEIALGNAGRVAKRERRVAHGSANRTPQVDHLNPTLKQFVRLGRQMLAHPVGAQRAGLVDMYPCCRLPRAGAADAGCSRL